MPPTGIENAIPAIESRWHMP